ncbi:MAG TPA: TPM domain-containing protein [Rubrobacter sp.]|nr:TPM domain-containing protein [Rubrobacter sp.]
MINAPTRKASFPVALAAALAFVLFSPASAAAQGSDTILDEADELSGSEEQQVQQAFDAAQQETGQPLYAILTPETGVDDQAARQELLIQEAREAGVPQNAGVVLVAPDDGWAQTYNFPQDAYNTMVPDFRNGDFAAGLVAGAEEIAGEPVAAQGGTDPGAGGLPGGGLLFLLLAAAGVFALFRNRRNNRRRAEEERKAAEEEFAELTTRLDEFDGRERLVSGYLEAQRPLLDQRTEEWVEAKISDARTAGFAREFNEASSLLSSDPVSARGMLARGRGLLEDALGKLDEAEGTIDDYRAADEALDGKLGAAREEIRAAEEAERAARAEGVAVQPLGLLGEYDPLAREAADRASRRDEFDPRRTLDAVEDLTRRARERKAALREEVAARDALPDERHAAEGDVRRARQALDGYRVAYERALSEFGPAALGDAPDPGELSTRLLHADGCFERADRAASAGRFAEARALLREAAGIAGEVMRAPGHLKTAVAEADRRKREGEERLNELEARLAQAKANEHLMGPYQRQRLREYEYQLGNARYGFFGGDWLTALLLFEALDNDYAYMGDPSAFAGDDWGGGDFGGGGFGGGDFGGGDF